MRTNATRALARRSTGAAGSDLVDGAELGDNAGADAGEIGRAQVRDGRAGRESGGRGTQPEATQTAGTRRCVGHDVHRDLLGKERSADLLPLLSYNKIQKLVKLYILW